MNQVCDKHKAKPERIYGQCVGCELESLRVENKRLQQELEQAEKYIEKVQSAGYV